MERLKIAGLVVIALAAVAGIFCYLKPGILVSGDKALIALANEGWDSGTVTSKHWFAPKWAGGCGEGDAVGFEIEGVNPRGKEGKATVCCGFWPKGCTVRH